jgi:ferric-dicitrate binding protein FerR (iron transport regulator)
MMVFNKRNAFVGWLVIAMAKPLAKQKAAMTARRAKSKRGGIVAGLVAAVGAAAAGLMFWRKRQSGDENPGENPGEDSGENPGETAGEIPSETSGETPSES